MKKDVLKEMQHGLQKRKTDSEQNSVIREVNRLLEYDNAKDNNILRSIGQNSTLVQSENERGAIIELEKKEKFYSGIVFTEEQIINVALKYRLKFLPSAFFKSYIDPLITIDVKELERSIARSMEIDQATKRNQTLEEYIAENGNNKFEFDNGDLKNKFYILAPGKCFKTDKAEMFATKAPDPILFYKIDEGHYRVVRKWGNDFTIFRRLLGIALQSRRALYWVSFFSILTISLFLSLLFGWGWMGLMALAGINIAVVYAPEWHSDFFGKKYTTSRFSF